MQLAVAANSGPARQGSLTIAGRSVAVTQASGCTYSITPSGQNLPGAGGTGAVSVMTASGCSWNVIGTAAWVTLSVPSGIGPGPVQFVVAPNPSITRTTTFTIAGQTFTITQASPCSFVLAPPYLTYDESGGNGAVLVIVSGPCTWTARSAADWIAMVSGTSGAGDGLVQFTVAPNTGQTRSGHVIIAGQNFAVTQAGK